MTRHWLWQLIDQIKINSVFHISANVVRHDLVVTLIPALHLFIQQPVLKLKPVSAPELSSSSKSGIKLERSKVSARVLLCVALRLVARNPATSAQTLVACLGTNHYIVCLIALAVLWLVTLLYPFANGNINFAWINLNFFYLHLYMILDGAMIYFEWKHLFHILLRIL